MKVSARLAVIERLGSELQNRYGFAQTYAFLRAFSLRPSGNFNDFEDVKDLVFYALSDAEESVLSEMIDDLGVESLSQVSASIQPPSMWADDLRMRVFVSHLSLEKQKATRLRDTLAPFGMSAFVAHEDIEPTLEWQVQIERALHSMELFVSMHTPGFKDSVWAQQEIGFAIARGVKIIAVRMGEDPKGFISKHQALSRGEKTAEKLASEIAVLLEKDQRTSSRYQLCKLAADDDIPF